MHPNRKMREFERRERDILDTTLTLLTGEQWQTISVDKIAQCTGIGKGTVYKHFDCKNDIYAHLLLDNYRQMLTQLKRLAADDHLTGVQQIRGMLVYTLEYHRENVAHQHMHLHFRQKAFREQISSSYLQQLDDTEEQFIEAFEQAVYKGITEGDVNPDIPRETMMAGVSATFEGAIVMLQEGGCCKQQMMQTAEQKDAYINHVVDYMIAALIRQPADKQEKR
ncbi:transcriptional regulator, TetR family [Amphritea atlantica]|uniref:Transcriptional regulator, TetR family n=1 Tax=Amphritea atlantica TaxID=355243 RepID=A0A1H9M6Z3_9GAMM|nr:TetR/AcrR family transcriptional regulator [Amphritea atlantica]SER18903.1 transcriptional regulator, TetR family [Amphritea atlantica]